MPDALWLLLAALLSLVGMAWLALAKEAHWKQAMSGSDRAGKTGASPRHGLQATGAAGLVLSLLVCLQADSPAMAILVWVMLMAVGATGVALILAWRPRWLALLACLPGS